MNKIILDKDREINIKPCVATIGFFDGVHKGHQYLIKRVIEEADISGMESTVITFDKHPRQVLHSDYIPELLSTTDEKLIMLARTNVDNTVLIHFNEETASLSAFDFMKNILHDKLNVKKLIIGYDNRFGHNRTEGFDDYVNYGQRLGIEVIHNHAYMINGVNVSSSVVRTFIKDGEMEMAEECLGYPYSIMGRVVTGQQNGRKIGFPTANIDTSEWGQLIPAPGVYAVKVRLNKSVAWHPAMMDIGTRPTFDGKGISLEVNIFNFENNIYGEPIQVSFIHRIREEQKFSSPNALAKQLEKDKDMVIKQFYKDNEE